MWVRFHWKDALDLIVVAGLLYAVLLLLRRTHSRFIVTGISLLLVLYATARFLNLYLTTTLFQAFLAFFAVIIAVVFQRELRSFIEWLSGWARWSRSRQAPLPDRVADQLVDALLYLAQRKIGALIVLPGSQVIHGLVQGGIPLNGQVSTPLLLSLFDPSSPGHDGAVVVEGGRVSKFSVHLPLAEHFEHYNALGTRHRAALGLAERSDALVLAVSEERGTISVASGGELRTLAPSETLRADLAALLKARVPPEPVRPWHWLLTQNLREKAIAAGLALLLWAIFVASQGAGVVTRPYDVPVEFQFLPQGYGVSEVSPQTITVTLSGRNQDFNLLDPEALRVVVRLPGGGDGTPARAHSGADDQPSLGTFGRDLHAAVLGIYDPKARIDGARSSPRGRSPPSWPGTRHHALPWRSYLSAVMSSRSRPCCVPQLFVASIDAGAF